jgi:hypothetical protein
VDALAPEQVIAVRKSVKAPVLPTVTQLSSYLPICL